MVDCLPDIEKTKEEKYNMLSINETLISYDMESTMY